jgi:hypothetical protein
MSPWNGAGKNGVTVFNKSAQQRCLLPVDLTQIQLSLDNFKSVVQIGP